MKINLNSVHVACQLVGKYSIDQRQKGCIITGSNLVVDGGFSVVAI